MGFSPWSRQHLLHRSFKSKLLPPYIHGYTYKSKRGVGREALNLSTDQSSDAKINPTDRQMIRHRRADRQRDTHVGQKERETCTHINGQTCVNEAYKLTGIFILTEY